MRESPREARSSTEDRRDLPGGRGQESLQDLEPQVRAATVGYVAAAAPLLAQPVLGSGDTLDAAAVQFLLAQTLLQRQREEEEAAQRLVKEAEEAKEREERKAKYEEKMLVVNRRVRDSSSSSVKRRKNKNRKRKWRRVDDMAVLGALVSAQLPSLMPLTILSFCDASSVPAFLFLRSPSYLGSHLFSCPFWSSSGSCCLATRPVWTRRTVLPWLWQWHLLGWFCRFRSSRCFSSVVVRP